MFNSFLFSPTNLIQIAASVVVAGLALVGWLRYRSWGLATLAFGRIFLLVHTVIWYWVIDSMTGRFSNLANAPLLAVLSLVGTVGNVLFGLAAVLLLMRDFQRYRQRLEAAEALAYRVSGSGIS